MDFIYDIDFVFSLIRFEPGFLDEVSDIVDSSIARRIYLDDIEHTPIIERDTIRTCMTRIPITQ